ncbi:hypothetical protein GH714_025191 [Hevea brasiliensis]|uniref:RIN4 pathogenic type III effector avirulence factor Avr cleavage site domain-containing protein n=1 Tax=Hevea brasiliensis TaxID=3981 RepID=A0A6A6KWI2_HEVBR|nr:hypothetical protein GH714_025191 [Hevea brasiliensis]
MEDYYYSGNHVPAFGSWDWNDDLPFTQCFESARQAGLLRYSYSEDRDLYVTGDLYESDVVAPAMIVVPRRRKFSRKGNAFEFLYGELQNKLVKGLLGMLSQWPHIIREHGSTIAIARRGPRLLLLFFNLISFMIIDEEGRVELLFKLLAANLCIVKLVGEVLIGSEEYT